MVLLRLGSGVLLKVLLMVLSSLLMLSVILRVSLFFFGMLVVLLVSGWLGTSCTGLLVLSALLTCWLCLSSVIGLSLLSSNLLLVVLFFLMLVVGLRGWQCADQYWLKPLRSCCSFVVELLLLVPMALLILFGFIVVLLLFVELLFWQRHNTHRLLRGHCYCNIALVLRMLLIVNRNLLVALLATLAGSCSLSCTFLFTFTYCLHSSSWLVSLVRFAVHPYCLSVGSYHFLFFWSC